jgi:hypothetical protein
MWAKEERIQRDWHAGSPNSPAKSRERVRMARQVLGWSSCRKRFAGVDGSAFSPKRSINLLGKYLKPSVEMLLQARMLSLMFRREELLKFVLAILLVFLGCVSVVLLEIFEAWNLDAMYFSCLFSITTVGEFNGENRNNWLP